MGVTSLAALQADDPRRVGPYLLLGRLGSGGMGRVYLARSPGGRQVAVKVIRPQLAEDAGFRARFAREVSSARKVGGLFTAQVVDADLDSPVPWLVTAYVPGTSLSEAVDQQGPLPEATTLALAAGLAEGLNAIHAAGVIHRDLKPSNVLLAPDGPRIIDFGISSAVDATSLTGTGLMIGSPGFMSPEQAEGLPVGPSSDIFSLAGVLSFAARGEGPFGSGDTAALLYRVVHGTANLDQIPAKIRPLISRCLSRDATLRPTASEFLTELTAAYPSAADLTDWLPAGILELSAQRVAEVDPHPSSVSAAGSAGSASWGAPAPGDGAAEPASPGALASPAAFGPAPTAVAKPAAVSGPPSYSGLATSNNASDVPTRTANSPVPPATQAGPQRYQGPQAYQAPQGYQGATGRQGPGGYQAPQAPQGYPGYLGQAGSGGQEGQRGGSGGSWPQDTPGWGAQPGGGFQQPDGGFQGGGFQGGGAQGGGGFQQPGGGAQGGGGFQGGGTQAPYPGQDANQWYSPLMQPAPRRRRRWPWAVGAVAAVCAVIVAAVVLSLNSGHSVPNPPAAGSRPSTAVPSATPTPTVGNLQLYQLRAGDCLTGADMALNTTNPWPKLTLAVPCNQAHTAEVFFADNKFWSQNSPFPGSSKVSKEGNAACNDAFRAYVGIAYSKSIYTWTNIIPDASTWPNGDRGLHCVAYYSTPQQRAGVTLTHSIKGSRK
jgi:serine/threonine protein kinase